MFPPVLFLLWVVYQDLAQAPIAEIEPSTLVSEELGLDERLTVPTNSCGRPNIGT